MHEVTLLSQALDQFDNFLDEVCGDVTVNGHIFQASRVLKKIDPSTYQQDFDEWCYARDEIIDFDTLILDVVAPWDKS